MIHYILKDALDLREERQIKILRYLVEVKTSTTYHEICKVVGASLKTIKNDLEYLNEKFQHIFCIKNGEDDFVEIQIYDGDVKSMMLAFYHSTKCIQILNLILKRRYSSISLASELHIAHSTCYVHLKKVKNFLQRYNLKLTNKYFTITGEETEIRKLIFLLEYVKNQMDGNNGFADELVRNIEIVGINCCPIVKAELRLIVDIVFKRVGAKKNIEISNEIKKNIQESFLYCRIYTSLQNFFKEKGMNLPEGEIDYLILYLLNRGNLLTEEDNEKELERIEKNKSIIRQATSELIGALKNRIPISLKNNEEFFQHLMAFVKRKYIKTKFISFDYFFENLSEKRDRSELALDYIHNKEVKVIEDIFYSWAQNFELKNIEQKDIEKCMILIESYELQKKQNNVYNIFLYISEGPEWERFIRLMLKETFGNKIHITSYYSNFLDNNYLKREIDFIISDIKVDFNINAEVIIIEDVYNLSAIQKLKMMI